MKKLIFTALVCLLILTFCVLLGCEPKNTKYDSFKAKMSQMDVKLLRTVALHYKEELGNNRYEILLKSFSYIAPADAPFTPEMGAAIATAFSEGNGPDFQKINEHKYILKMIKEKGGDTSDLEFNLLQIDLENFKIPPRNDYLFPPIKKMPSPYIESDTIGPA